MKKKHKNDLKSAIMENKWQVAVILLFIFIAATKFNSNKDSSSIKSTVPLDEIPGKSQSTPNIINASKTSSWNGNDPALSHDIGLETAGNAWNSGEGGHGYLSAGPYITIGPGPYQAIFDLKLDGITNNSKYDKSKVVCTLEVSYDSTKTIVKKDLYVSDFPEGQYRAFPLYFFSGMMLRGVEFRVNYPSSGFNLTLRKIVLTFGKDNWPANNPSLSHDVGREGSAGMWTSTEGSEGYMVKGPHISLGPGVYEVSYTFLIEGFPTDESEHLASIDVTHNGGETFLYGKLLGVDFIAGRNPKANVMYKSFINRLYVDEPLTDVEFRLYYPNSSFKVTLKDITLFIK